MPSLWFRPVTTYRRRPATRPHPLVLQLTLARRRLGLTQAALAIRIGVAETTITDWENGRAYPGLLNLLNWAEGLQFRLSLQPAERPSNHGPNQI